MSHEDLQHESNGIDAGITIRDAMAYAAKGLRDDRRLRFRVYADEVVEREFHKLFAEAVNNEGTAYLRILGVKQCWKVFRDIWPKIKYGINHVTWLETMQHADASPLPPSALQYEQPWQRRFVAWCKARHDDDGGMPFKLNSRAFAKRLGKMHFTTVHRFIRQLVKDGVLLPAGKVRRKWKRLKKAPYKPARLYRYNAAKDDELLNGEDAR